MVDQSLLALIQVTTAEVISDTDVFLPSSNALFLSFDSNLAYSCPWKISPPNAERQRKIFACIVDCWLLDVGTFEAYNQRYVLMFVLRRTVQHISVKWPPGVGSETIRYTVRVSLWSWVWVLSSEFWVRSHAKLSTVEFCYPLLFDPWASSHWSCSIGGIIAASVPSYPHRVSEICQKELFILNFIDLRDAHPWNHHRWL